MPFQQKMGKVFKKLFFPQLFVEKSNFHKIKQKANFFDFATKFRRKRGSRLELSTFCPRNDNNFSTEKKSLKTQCFRAFERLIHSFHRAYYLLKLILNIFNLSHSFRYIAREKKRKFFQKSKLTVFCRALKGEMWYNQQQGKESDLYDIS